MTSAPLGITIGGGVAVGGGAGTSQSSSQSYLPDYPQSSLLQSIASYAGQLGDATYNWGQQQYAKTSALSDQNINSYLTTSAQALANSQNDEQRYQTLFQPQENSLVQDANSYNSNARQQYEMGRAESQTGAAMDAARQNHQQQLQAYGIDPSSGRYDELDRADQLAKSAAQAGAGQQAYQNTAATGRQLRADAIQVGARYPGQITNEQNTALQGYAGAENSNLANANTGVALTNAADPYLNTASSLKYPPLGSTSQSTSTSPASGGGGGGGKSPSDPAPPQQNGGSGGGSGGGGSGGGGSGGGSGTGASVSGAGSAEGDGTDTSGSGDGSVFDTGSGYSYDGANTDPFSSAYSSDPSGNNNDLGAYSDPSLAPQDGSVFDTGSSSSYTDAGTGGAGGLDYSSYAGGDGTFSGDSSGGDYAQGGSVHVLNRQAGGHVPAGASPSGGQRTDDIHANLNANEFVIPKDVALWKGQEFFQNLIADARKKNAMAAAKPAMNRGQR
jgi:hypothetical protein